ncbi:Cytosine deaminase [Fulvia fulva]|uniref:Cytosine deaminase n=1 Tax=Passalora fulva TaxID=5499 RepID=A0A9Q8LEN5_PASFU|nr:Cytosine deaminase [Fulvia fulva]KAK4626640.1 Cytosine deaminase [Fulvia fulva]KAK4628133.1 Cytosine deaminase [Fulvia fulva]UJO16015.1 Cytosine deaminase [Fulvia fulva]WPV13940.1 Cytosine deaminase [Fulvia fulva]WPV28717.1 Cytosine deaminase [Fulvia fulva]
MAGDFLKSHGIDIDAEMARIQNAGGIGDPQAAIDIHNVSLPQTQPDSLWNVRIRDQNIEKIVPAEYQLENAQNSINGASALLAPSLCHPHIHLDKAFLLSHPKYAHLNIEKGDFQEAMTLTGQAKSEFEHDDLLERGQRVVDESVAAGVTHMRAFVELDAGVGEKCLDAGIALRKQAAREKICHVQLCAFAQLPLFSPAQSDEDGSVIRSLMRRAAGNDEVEAIGSTPYVETDREKMKKNVEWMVELSIEYNKHLDFHLDYNLDPENEPLIWHVIDTLQATRWNEKTKDRTIVLGHCTRLTLFNDSEWVELAGAIKDADLPVSFVGLPTSDLFMMRTGQTPEIRGTLDVPKLVKQYGLNTCIGVNNIGNAFTPQGSCDPLSLASQAVGVHQAGTAQDTELLYECVSTRAKAAIGVGGSSLHKTRLAIQKDDRADLLLFGAADQKDLWRTRKAVSTAIYLYDHCKGRRGFYKGTLQA